MRCVHVFSGDLWAGAEVATVRLVQETAQRPGVELRVVTLNDGPPAATLRQSSIRVDVFPEDRMGFAAIAAATIRLTRDWRPNVIHSHRHKEQLLATISAAVSGAVHLRTAQGLPPQLRWGGPPRRFGRSPGRGDLELGPFALDCRVRRTCRAHLGTATRRSRHTERSSSGGTACDEASTSRRLRLACAG